MQLLRVFFKECKKQVWQLHEICLASSLMVITNKQLEPHV
jgi:hypothetical protein